MAKYRLLYSCGLTRRDIHCYICDDEMLVDLKTFELDVSEAERHFGDIWIVLAGKDRYAGYESPEIPFSKLHESYMELLKKYDGNEEKAIKKLLRKFKFKRKENVPAKYPNRYCVQS